jgi:hypothetical protein
MEVSKGVCEVALGQRVVDRQSSRDFCRGPSMWRKG